MEVVVKRISEGSDLNPYPDEYPGITTNFLTRVRALAGGPAPQSFGVSSL
jgi:hypothetical protein